MSEPLHAIVRRLSRAGWGELAPRSCHGAKTVLIALAAQLPDDGAGKLTLWQVAAAAGRCVRRTSDILAQLERLGILVWYRGGIIDGHPVAGWMRVSKTCLWAMIDPARRRQDNARRRHYAATRARIRETLRLSTYSPRRDHHTAEPVRYRRLSVHADITATLPPIGGGSNSAPSTPKQPKGHIVDNLSRRREEPPPLPPEPTYWEELAYGRRVVVNPNVCDICHEAPHGPTVHHAFEPSRATAELALRLGWPTPTGQGVLL